MKRGELYRVFKPGGDAKQYRTFVVVSRQTLIDSKFPSLVCAAVMTEGQGLATQVAIGIDEGMKHESWIHCDDLRSIQKPLLTRWVGTLTPGKMRKLDYALTVALDLPF
jgi:mRNA interferase MazF